MPVAVTSDPSNNGEPGFPADPGEFLSLWARSRGNIRHFIEDTAAPPLGDEEQREAGEAAAAEAIRETFGLGFDEFTSGVDSVSGAFHSAGRTDRATPDPDIPVDTGAAAFFDVDNTLIQGSSLVELAVGMTRKKFFRLSEITPFLWKQIKYKISGKENAGDVAAGRMKALEFIKGRPVADLVALGEEIVDDKMIEKTYAGTRALAQMHLDAGQQVWLVTATPVQLAHILADRLGLTGALGTVPEVEDGRFTGRLVGDILHGPGKAHAVGARAAMENLDLSRCTAYSDSSNDLPMLSMVGTAVAINPDAGLKKEAKARGWAVRDYRSMRQAVRRWGVPTLVAAAFSLNRVQRYRRGLHLRADQA